jgi:hypothetical protein
VTADTGAELAADLTAAGKPQVSPWPLAEETLLAHPERKYLWDTSLPVRPATDEEKAQPMAADLAAIIAGPEAPAAGPDAAEVQP